MRRLIERFQRIMMAAAFAEEGDFDSARQIIEESELKKTARPSVDKRERPDGRKQLRAE